MITCSKVYLDDVRFSSARGGYVLILELDAKKNISVGSLEMIQFPAGFYAYLGSALGGFKSRLNRHITRDKEPRWHIDYLLNKARILRILLCDTQRRLECLLSQVLAEGFSSIRSFGSSDCRCKSHLYFADDESSLDLGIRKAITRVVSPQESFTELTGL